MDRYFTQLSKISFQCSMSESCSVRQVPANWYLRRADAGAGWRKKAGTAEIRVAAGPDCEVGVKRYAYCRRNLLFAITFQWRSGELMRGGWISDGFGIKIVRFFREIRGDSNRIIHYRLAITLISEKELPTGRKCCADWGWIAGNAQHFTWTSYCNLSLLIRFRKFILCRKSIN